MSLKQLKKKYPDAVQAQISVSNELLNKNNFYTGNGLREYVRKLFPEKCVLECFLVDKTIEVITSKGAYTEEKRQLSITPGTIVKMQEQSGEVKMEPNLYKGKEFSVIAGPQCMCGNWVVWMEGFSGAYSCELLDIIKSAPEEPEVKTN